MSVPTLLLLRHATTEAGRPGGTDAERQLTAAGRAEAAAVGAFLRETGLGVDAVLCSPAVRTRATLDELDLPGPVGTAPVVSVARWLYRAEPAELVEQLADHDAATLLVVGHAPAVPAAAALLADHETSAAPALAALQRGYPPATLARLERREDRWRLVAVRVPGEHGR